MQEKKAKIRNNKLHSFAKERIKFIDKIQNSNKPFWIFVGVFFASILARFILEVSLSHYSNTYFDLPGFLLMFFYYVSLILSVLIIFHLFTKEDLKKLSKIILPTIVLIIIPPIIDFILSQGKGFTEGYLLPTTNILFAFFTMGGTPISNGITIGLRIEIFILLFLCLYYFQIKKPNILKNLLKTAIIYCIIFCYLSTIILIKPFFGFFSIDLYDFWYQLIASTYLFFILIQLAILFYIYNKQLFKLIILDLRPTRIIHFIAMFLIGVFISIKIFNPYLGFDFWLSTGLTTMGIIFAWLFSVAQNNIQDFKIDSVSNKTRPLQLGISLEQYSILPPFFLFLAISFAITAGILSLISTILFIMAYFVYSNPPFRLKQIPIFSKLSISFSSLLFIITGFILAGGTLATFPISIVILFLVGFTLAINFIDIKDYLGDKKEKINTLPVLLGLKNSKVLISIFFIIAYALSYFVIEKIELIPFLILFSGIEFILINKKDYQELPVFIVYILSLIVIAFFYLI